MADSDPYIRLLASIPAFAAFNADQLHTLYGCCALKVIAKGERASVAGEPVDELCIVVSGRVAAREPGVGEAGPGEPVEAEAFFMRGPARATAIAMRETVLLTLGWDEFAAALQANPDILAASIASIGTGMRPARRTPKRLSRLAVCPAGSQRRLDAAVKEALLAGLESLAEVRVLGRRSFGAGLPGAISIDSPETVHWLQEQELDFDLTVIFADEADADFAVDAIEEAGGLLFVASGAEAGLSELERHALNVRGAENCRLVLAKSDSGPVQNAPGWFEPRRYRSMQAVDFASPDAVRFMCQALLGQGHAVSAASPGVYAAAILGALQAFEERGEPAVCFAAAGSAILPAGLLACGIKLSVIESIFGELANPLLWKRLSKPEASLCDPTALDNYLVGTLRGLEIEAAGRPFVAVSRSLSAGAPEVHREGRLHGAVRAGIAPPGILPPLILDSGDILISGENETEALLAAAERLTAAPVSLLHAKMPPLGTSTMSYRSLTGSSLFKLTQASADKRVRLETVISAGGASSCGLGGVPSFAIPIPQGIMPMDWQEWATLRDAGYAWMSKELETRAQASAIDAPVQQGGAEETA